MTTPTMKCLCVISFLLLSIIAPTTAVNFFPFGPTVQDTALEKRDDAVYPVDISTPFAFFGKVYNRLEISTNGLIFFGQGTTAYTPTLFPLNGTDSVAAYWVDSDPREGGNIFFREEFSPSVLNQISTKIKQAFVEFNDFTSNWALITTFDNVPRYRCRDCNKVVNYQIILTTNGRNSFVIFLYDKLDYADAQTGFNAGDGRRFYLLPGSNTPNSGSEALSKSNIGFPGEWVFSINEVIRGGCQDVGRLEVFPKKSLYIGNQDIYLSGPCLNQVKKHIIVQIGVNNVTCNITNNSKIHCITPYSNGAKRVDVEIKQENATFKSFLLLHDLSDRMVGKLNSEYTNNVSSDGLISVKFGEIFKDQEMLKIRGMQQNLYLDKKGKLIRFENFDVYTDIINIGYFKFPIKGVKSMATAGLVVRWVFGVTNSSGRGIVVTRTIELNASLTCDKWYDNEPSNQLIKEIVQKEAMINPCPPKIPKNAPSYGGFEIDDACKYFSENGNCKFHPAATVCYTSTNNPNNIAVQCCYNKEYHLIMGPYSGGTLNMVDANGKVSNSRINHFVVDVWPYVKCCVFENKCGKYYEKRPSVGSRGFVKPGPTFRASGDPHFITLDAFAYTFNPIGEFTYLRTPESEVQCRISQYANTKAAQFSAFAVQTEEEDTVQVGLNAQNNLLVTIGETILSPDLYSFENITVDFTNDTTVGIRTTSGIEMNIYALEGMLHAVSTMSQNLKGQVSGLVGIWDDNQENDLMTPSGTVIPTNSTTSEIHFLFGMTWKNSPDSSIFTYPAGQSWSDYHDPTFVPNLETIPENPQCNNNAACLYDLFVTGDIKVAMTNLIITEISETKNLENENISKTCMLQKTVSNGRVSLNASKHASSADYELSCDDSYVIYGDSRMVCKEGKYYGEIGSCEKYTPQTTPFSSSASCPTLAGVTDETGPSSSILHILLCQLLLFYV